MSCIRKLIKKIIDNNLKFKSLKTIRKFTLKNNFNKWFIKIKHNKLRKEFFRYLRKLYRNLIFTISYLPNKYPINININESIKLKLIFATLKLLRILIKKIKSNNIRMITNLLLKIQANLYFLSQKYIYYYSNNLKRVNTETKPETGLVIVSIESPVLPSNEVSTSKESPSLREGLFLAKIF